MCKRLAIQLRKDLRLATASPEARVLWVALSTEWVDGIYTPPTGVDLVPALAVHAVLTHDEVEFALGELTKRKLFDHHPESQTLHLGQNDFVPSRGGRGRPRSEAPTKEAIRKREQRDKKKMSQDNIPDKIETSEIVPTDKINCPTETKENVPGQNDFVPPSDAPSTVATVGTPPLQESGGVFLKTNSNTEEIQIPNTNLPTILPSKPTEDKIEIVSPKEPKPEPTPVGRSVESSISKTTEPEFDHWALLSEMRTLSNGKLGCDVLGEAEFAFVHCLQGLFKQGYTEEDLRNLARAAANDGLREYKGAKAIQAMLGRPDEKGQRHFGGLLKALDLSRRWKKAHDAEQLEREKAAARAKDKANNSPMSSEAKAEAYQKMKEGWKRAG